MWRILAKLIENADGVQVLRQVAASLYVLHGQTP